MTAIAAAIPGRSRAATSHGPVYAGLLLVLLGAMLASLSLGYRLYSLPELWAALFANDGSETATVIAGLRLPRALLAPVVGAALGMSGVMVQTLARNRIASPDTLGLNAGASLAVVIATVMLGVQSLVGLSLAAALGALITSLVVFGLAAGSGGLSALKIVLVGVTVASLAHAAVQVLLTSNEVQLQQLLFWLSGAFVDRPISLLFSGLPVVLAGTGGAFVLAGALDAVQADDTTAAGLGVPLVAVRGAAFVSVSLLTGAAVSMAGPVAFVGLVVPHMARRLVGLRHRHQLLAAALTGAIYTTLADVAARFVIYPVEAPVGAITAVIGGVALLALLMRRLA